MNNKITVPQDQYLEALGFTAYVYLSNKITKYSGMGGQKTRTLGEFIENMVYGKIGELAFKIFLKDNFNIDVLTEIDIAGFYSGVYLPDIPSFSDGRALNFWIDIKEVRRDQKWLLIPASSLTLRAYDAYVAVWVGLPDEHILWLIENVPYIKSKMDDSWKKIVQKLADEIKEIECEVIGYVTWNDVDHVKKYFKQNDNSSKEYLEQKFKTKSGNIGANYFQDGDKLYDPENPEWQGSQIKENIGFYIPSLKDSSNWQGEFRILITENKRLIGAIPIPKTKKGNAKKSVNLPDNYVKNFNELRDATQKYLEDQLEKIKSGNNNSLKRNKSWFSEEINEV
jgi:hypothetical protein